MRSVNVDDIVNDTARLPFINRSAWRDIQGECPDLRRVHSHLKQGTRPSKTYTSIKDVKRYLQVVTISKDGVLDVKRSEPFSSEKEQKVVPRSVLYGLLTVMHVKLGLPTKLHLDLVVRRYFFALDMKKAIERAAGLGQLCASL
jgi:hypothetical protein